jgi:hypothetical protein
MVKWIRIRFVLEHSHQPILSVQHRSVQVSVHEGHVTLTGPVLAAEVSPLLRSMRKIPGMVAIEDRLSAYHEAGNISALQSGVPRYGERFELLQSNWSPAARLLTGVLGTCLIARSVRRHSAGTLLRGCSTHRH